MNSVPQTPDTAAGSSNLIELIVREVVRRLREEKGFSRVGTEIASESTSAVQGCGCASTPKTFKLANLDSKLDITNEPKVDASRRRMDGRVVSLQSLRELPLEVRELEVQPKTIVTPAVIDELKSRKIKLVRKAASAEKPGKSVVIGCLANDVSSIGELLGKTSIDVRANSTAELLDLLAVRIGQLGSGKSEFAVAFTSQPFNLLFEANRRKKLRAAWIRSDAERMQATSELAPNLFVLNIPQLKSERPSWVQRWLS
jgi:hypothetical protein